MTRRKTKVTLNREEVAVLLEEIAERIAAGDRSFDLQLQIGKAENFFLGAHDLEGLQLLNRLSLLLSTEGGKVGRYEYVRKIVQDLPALDPAKDADGLRALANAVRSNRS